MQALISKAEKQRIWLDGVALAILLGFTSYLLISHLMSFFEFFDQSGFMDAAYRVSRGQKIYTDFIFIAGPIHPYIGALFIKVFGFGKWAIWANVLVLNLAITVTAYILMPRTLSLAIRMILIGLCSMCFLGPFTNPHYDHHAFLFLLIGISLFKVRLSRDGRHDAGLRGFACGILAALAFFTKANIGGVAGVIFFVALASSKYGMRALLFLALGFCFSANLIVFSMESPFDFVEQAFLSQKFGGRLHDVFKLKIIALFSPYINILSVGVLLGFCGGVNFIKNHRLDFILFLGIVFASFFSTWTGSATPEKNIFILGFVVLFVVIIVEKLPRGFNGADSRILHAARFLALAIGIFVAWGAWSAVSNQFLWTKKDDRDVTYALRVEQLKGWRCNPAWGEGVDEVVRYIQTHIPKADSIFVFPDSTVIYGLTGRDSYKGAPFQFVKGQLPQEGKLYTRFLIDFTRRPPQWIVLRDLSVSDFQEISTGPLMKWLHFDFFFKKFYKLEWHFGNYSILKLVGFPELSLLTTPMQIEATTENDFR